MNEDDYDILKLFIENVEDLLSVVKISVFYSKNITLQKHIDNVEIIFDSALHSIDSNKPKE